MKNFLLSLIVSILSFNTHAIDESIKDYLSPIKSIHSVHDRSLRGMNELIKIYNYFNDDLTAYLYSSKEYIGQRDGVVKGADLLKAVNIFIAQGERFPDIVPEIAKAINKIKFYNHKDGTKRIQIQFKGKKSFQINSNRLTDLGAPRELDRVIIENGAEVIYQTKNKLLGKKSKRSLNRNILNFFRSTEYLTKKFKTMDVSTKKYVAKFLKQRRKKLQPIYIEFKGFKMKAKLSIFKVPLKIKDMVLIPGLKDLQGYGARSSYVRIDSLINIKLGI